jgi:hypothetical protein
MHCSRQHFSACTLFPDYYAVRVCLQISKLRILLKGLTRDTRLLSSKSFINCRCPTGTNIAVPAVRYTVPVGTCHELCHFGCYSTQHCTHTHTHTLYCVLYDWSACAHVYRAWWLLSVKAEACCMMFFKSLSVTFLALFIIDDILTLRL